MIHWRLAGISTIFVSSALAFCLFGVSDAFDNFLIATVHMHHLDEAGKNGGNEHSSFRCGDIRVLSYHAGCRIRKSERHMNREQTARARRQQTRAVLGTSFGIHGGSSKVSRRAFRKRLPAVTCEREPLLHNCAWLFTPSPSTRKR